MTRPAFSAIFRAHRTGLLQNISVIPAELTEWAIGQARALGFDACGVAPAEEFEELRRLPEWLARDYAGEMAYLRDPRRGSPAGALPGARSLIVCALNYNTSAPCSTEVPAEAADGSAARGPGRSAISSNDV